MAQLTEPAAVRRLCERYGFAFGADRLVAAQAEGFDATLDRLLTTTAPDPGAARTPPPDLGWLPRPRGREQPAMTERKAWRRQMRQQQLQLGLWWLDRMVAVEQPTREKLTWFWHGHFATSARKVRIAAAMLAQNQTFRTHALGSFTDLAQAMRADRRLEAELQRPAPTQIGLAQSAHEVGRLGGVLVNQPVLAAQQREQRRLAVSRHVRAKLVLLPRNRLPQPLLSIHAPELLPEMIPG